MNAGEGKYHKLDAKQVECLFSSTPFCLISRNYLSDIKQFKQIDKETNQQTNKNATRERLFSGYLPKALKFTRC